MDLEQFGQRLAQLRKKAGLSQNNLASQLFVDAQLISRWEKAYQHGDRRWKPDFESVIYLIKLFSDYLNPLDAQGWALQAGYELSRTRLEEIFPTYLYSLRQFPPLPDTYVSRRGLEQIIFDALTKHSQALTVLLGPGGIGKTTLAAWAANALADYFPDGVIWIENLPGDDETQVRYIQEAIFRSLWVVPSGNLAERFGELRTILHDKRILLVLDDLWAGPNLRYLRLHSKTGKLLVTSRDAKVAELLNAGLVIRIPRLNDEEGLSLLSAHLEAGLTAGEAGELVTRLGGLPLALKLSTAQLKTGLSFTDLLRHLRQEQADLSILDLDDPQTQAESLILCFDLSYQRLKPIDRQRFAQLACFVGSIGEEVATAVWGVTTDEARRTLQRLLRFALLYRDGTVYRLHPLLRAYAQKQLADQPVLERKARCRHITWYILYALYHPQVLDDVTDKAPSLDQSWADIVSGVKWSAAHAPHLTAVAALLAHTERPALLEEIGPDLIAGVIIHCSQITSAAEQAILYELLGDLYLLKSKFADGLAYFEAAAGLWEATANWLAASRARLRGAGAHLLCQEPARAAEAARQAQSLFGKGLPIAPDELEAARWLFYWFDMVYNPLVRWAELPEEDVASLADMARQTNDLRLEARGLHIYRLWCTSKVPRPATIRERGRQLAIQVYKLWRSCGQLDRADDELSWSGYFLNGRYSRRAAARFARRLSQTTPVVNQDQLKLVSSEGMRWWLMASETYRVAWLSRMLPRYLAASNCVRRPLMPGNRAWHWVDDILNVSVLGETGRRLTIGTGPPAEHILNGPEWRVLSGQKALPMVGPTAVRLVERYLAELQEVLGSSGA